MSWKKGVGFNNLGWVTCSELFSQCEWMKDNLLVTYTYRDANVRYGMAKCGQNEIGLISATCCHWKCMKTRQ